MSILKILSIVTCFTIFIACETNKPEEFQIESYPTILIYDTCKYINFECYDVSGKLTEEELREKVYLRASSQWGADIIIINNNTGIFQTSRTWDENNQIVSNYDTLDLEINRNSIVSRPRKLPKSVLIFDPNSSYTQTSTSEVFFGIPHPITTIYDNVRCVSDTDSIKQAYTTIFNYINNKFVRSTTALQIIDLDQDSLRPHMLTPAYKTYDNSYDLNKIYPLLNDNEILTKVVIQEVFYIE